MKITSISIDNETLNRIDEARKLTTPIISRSRFIRDAINLALNTE